MNLTRAPRVLLTLPVLALRLAACVPAEDDIWFPPAPAGGKADAVELLLGATIPSGYVDPAASYLHDRAIESLAEVGALDDVLASVAYRVDGVIANLPADGRIDVAELVRMEQPSFFATLFPDEQAAFPKLWPLLQIPASATTVANFPATAAVQAIDLSVSPGGLTFSPSELISSLASSYQTPSRRLQLVIDGDGNPNTISFADLQAAFADPSRFTAADVTTFEAVRAELHRRGVSSANARIQVDAPGNHTTTIAIGGLSLTVRDSTRYVETRSDNGSYSSGWSVQLEAQRSGVASVALPSGSSVILIREDDGSELVISNQLTASLANATYLVEEWHQGVRVASAKAHIENFGSTTANTDLTRYVEYQLVTAAGPLVRNVATAYTSYTNVVGLHSQAIAIFTHDAAAITPMATVESTALGEVASVGITIPAGRYELTTLALGTVDLDIYPQGVVTVTVSGVTRRLVNTGLDGKHKLDSGFVGGPRTVFDPSTNELWIAVMDGTSPVISTTLSDAVRVQ